MLAHPPFLGPLSKYGQLEPGVSTPEARRTKNIPAFFYFCRYESQKLISGWKRIWLPW